MFALIAVVAILSMGFGLGRVRHPANLKLSALKAEIAKIEVELTADITDNAIVARLKKLL